MVTLSPKFDASSRSRTTTKLESITWLEAQKKCFSTMLGFVTTHCLKDEDNYDSISNFVVVKNVQMIQFIIYDGKSLEILLFTTIFFIIKSQLSLQKYIFINEKKVSL